MYILILLLCLKPFELEIPMDQPKLYYYSQEANGALYSVPVEIESDLTLEEKVQYVVQALLSNDSKALSLIPEGTKLVGLSMKKRHLELVLSNDIMDYGGTLWEWGMINQLLATIFSIEEIDSISLWIEDEGRMFVEGTIIHQFTREEWKERKESDVKS